MTILERLDTIDKNIASTNKSIRSMQNNISAIKNDIVTIKEYTEIIKDCVPTENAREFPRSSGGRKSSLPLAASSKH